MAWEPGDVFGGGLTDDVAIQGEKESPLGVIDPTADRAPRPILLMHLHAFSRLHKEFAVVAVITN